ncbi:LLM class flavin-dependent oxidoreductase [Streptomyces sp. NPDC048659]|uniref:LLM class flavin-dependent oxidoreductase n=1 Tax=Streptomyces sp. NPDC048659 TaxID=3155489 RepID=UPI00343C9EF3
MPAAPALSVLDTTFIPTGSTSGRTVADSVRLARHAEGLGYRRLWVTEHHNHPALAAASPPVLLAHLAARTERIRVGSGGMLLPHHAPLAVAEQFTLLHAIHPDRVDLGVGRGAGTDPATSHALRRADPGEFAAQVSDLEAFLGHRDHAPGSPYRSVRTVPADTPGPPLWILGSSPYGARVAAARGLPFAFAHHFGGDTAGAIRLYRETFRPSKVLDRPYALISLTAVAAGTAAEARRHAAAQELAQLRIAQGLPDALLPADEAVALLAGRSTPFGARGVVGDPRSVAAELTALAGATGADELMIVTALHDQDARLRSYALIAEALDATTTGAATTG